MPLLYDGIAPGMLLGRGMNGWNGWRRIDRLGRMLRPLDERKISTEYPLFWPFHQPGNSSQLIWLNC